MLAAQVGLAQDINPNDPFFELIAPSNNTIPVKSSDTTLPSKANLSSTVAASEISGMLEKWATYEKGRQDKHSEEIRAARLVSAEMLVKKAISVPPTSRSLYASAAKLLTELKPNFPLGAGVPDMRIQKEPMLIGTWKSRHWKAEFTPGGLIFDKSKDPPLIYPWRWIDKEAGLLTCRTGMWRGDNWDDLFWLASPKKLLVMNSEDFRYSFEKESDMVPGLLKETILLNLNQTETSQRTALEDDLEQKRRRMVTWLKSKAAELPTEQIVNLLPKISELENDTYDGALRLSGTWLWDSMGAIKFLPGGIVTNKAGAKVGNWGWTLKAGSRFAMAFNGGKTANDIHVAKCPSSASDLSITVLRMGDGKFIANRTLP